MPLLPSRVWLDAAKAIAEETRLLAAFNHVLTFVCDSLLAHGMLLQWTAGGWTRVASHVVEARAAKWRSKIAKLGESNDVLVRLDADGEVATAVVVRTARLPLMMFVLDGDWDASRESLVALQALGFALGAARDRDALTTSRRFFVQVYRAARHLKPTQNVDTMAERVVLATAHILHASKVSLALNDPSGSLTIAGTHGLPESLRGQAIQRGHGVIGSVVQSRRAVLVNAPEQQLVQTGVERYRTASLVAVPIMAGGETIGVVCATDKDDGSPFHEWDRAALRGIAAYIAASLLYARTAAERDQVAHLAALDPVSGLHNRQYLDSRLQQEVDRTKREGTTVALMIADIDEFKQINDRLGHHDGDLVLKDFGDVIRSAVRSIDVCARYGGDEFVVVMPNTDIRSARACAQRIKSLVAEGCASRPATRSVTISVGVAVSTPDDDALSLFERADKALYGAKAAGKDRIHLDYASPAMASAVEPVRDLPYTLVADSRGERVALYREWLSPFPSGLLIARSGDEAIGLIARYGPPLLLVVDLGAASMRGEDLIERVRGLRTRVLAWTPAASPPPAENISDQIAYLPPGASMATAKLRVQGLLRSHQGLQEYAERAPAPSELIRASLADSVRWPAPGDSPVVETPGSAHRSPSLLPETPAVLLDRPWGEAIAVRELARARREQSHLSIVLFELAQRTPTTSGDTLAPAIDAFLKAVRESDLPIRWGTHELMLILPRLSGAEARLVAERVRAAIHAGGRHAILVAGGVAQADVSVAQFGEVVERARERLAQAVDRGHNRVH